MNGRDDDDERPTQATPSGRSNWGLSVNAGDSDDEKTTVARPERVTPKKKIEAEKTVSDRQDADADEAPTRVLKRPAAPTGVDLSRIPVGWLAIVDGPGLGHTFPLFYGSNRIGRGPGIEVSLDFGDQSISRGPHTRITYDAKGRRFYVQSGEGTGLTYRDGEPVLTPTLLDAHAHIEIGHTVLRFLPLCTAEFDWQDLPSIMGTVK